MDQKLSFSSTILVGTMLFGMYFGAGNLIFPVHMGQEAGSALWVATIGFLITAIGLPFLGIVAQGVSRSNGLVDMASRISPTYAKVFTFLLYITIGPAFAIPRTSTVSYTIGVAPFMGPEQGTMGLAVFSGLFFLVALLFSLNPGKLMTYIGKVLTPLFLLFLAVLLGAVVYMPMGDYTLIEPSGAYATSPLFKGLTEGYNTLDALASLAFGIIVIRTLQGLGVKESSHMAVELTKAGVIAGGFMVLLYGLLAYSGASSLGVLQVSPNGGIALSEINHFYFGSVGAILLALIVTLACLKTCIGLIGACAETFDELFPDTLGYRNFVYLTSFVGFAIANVGLTQIIVWSIPVLMFLYPLTITLILLSLLGQAFDNKQAVYVSTTAFALLAAVGDALAASPEVVQQLGFVQTLLGYYKLLPFFDLGMSWIVPSIIGYIIGMVYIIGTSKK